MENLLNFLKESSKNFLKREIEKEREACTYLFYGREGSNHLELALYFISQILCKEDKECEKLFYQNLTTYVHILEPKEDFIIKREDIKDIINKASHSSFSNKKFFIINSVENMREDGWNALLKTLEEPSNSIFILLSFNSKVPSTLLSRALSVNVTADLEKIEDKELFKFLNCNLKDYLNFKKENLVLKELEILPIEKSLENYIKNGDIKNKSLLIKSIKEFSNKIRSFNKIEKILLAEKLENIIEKDRTLLYEFFSLVIEEYSKNNSYNLELAIFLKECINKNVNISLILINFLINLS